MRVNLSILARNRLIFGGYTVHGQNQIQIDKMKQSQLEKCRLVRRRSGRTEGTS